MITRVKLILLAMVGVAQLGAAGWSIARYESTLASGTRYKIRVAPVDPADAFRGRYVAVRPEIAIGKPVDAETDELLEAVQYRHAPAYVTLATDEQGFARAAGIHPRPPAAGDYLTIADVRATWSPKPGTPDEFEQSGLAIGFSFDRYYMNERVARVSEEKYAAATRRNSTSQAWLLVRVRNGVGVIEGLFIDGVPIESVAKPAP